MMKKYFLTLISLIVISVSVFSQTFEMRTFLNSYDYIAVQLRQTDVGSQPNFLSTTDGDDIWDLVFTVRWDQSYGDINTDVICSNYNITKSGSRGSLEGDYYQQFGADQPFECPDDYVLNEWVTIATLKTTFASGSTNGTFELAINNWAGNLMVQIAWDGGASATEYYPTLVTGVCDNTPVPTTIYNYVWTGAQGGAPPQGKKWETNGNWSGTCPGDILPENTFPYFGQSNAYVFIPANLSKYPELSTNTDLWGWSCSKMFIENGAHVTVPDLTAANPSNPELYIDGTLTVEGTLNLNPKGHATVTGTTTINSAEGIVVQATSAGVGSFIDNGIINGTGTAKVQTYLSNSAGVNLFDIHLVGPTVDEESYTGTGTGAYLEEFILGGVDTYAYEWDESVPDSPDAWVNLSSLTEEIHSAKGIGLSTIDNTSHTLDMTGSLITGPVSSPVLTFSNNHWELISNPYPSSIDFDALYTVNSGIVNNKFSLWDPSANSWVEYAGGAGADKYIQVGQGFFVETNSTGTFDFTNTERSHSNNAFREIMPNLLTVTAEGGMEGYKDVAIIRFDDDATSGYDINIEAEFWESQNSDATSLRSVTEDNLELAINVLPTESLYGKDLLSVPLKFDCGYYSDAYTLSFTDMETFEYGTEIYLEDTKTDDNWVYLNDNPIYTFTAASYQSSDRFILHFFGPTDIEELSAEVVDIYSAGQYAYVRNNTQENIKMIYVYNLASELVMSTKDANHQKFSKFWISDQVGYYIVKVVTDTNIYTEKVLIFK